MSAMSRLTISDNIRKARVRCEPKRMEENIKDKDIMKKNSWNKNSEL